MDRENRESGVSGSCLCGSVQYEISGNQGVFQYCNCSRCRKFSGSAFSANLFVAPADFRWLQGEEHVGRYELPEARHFATCFCRNCGSSLPWITQSKRAVVIPAGTLDGDPGVKPAMSVYCGSRAQWYMDPGEIPAHDALPPRKAKKSD